MDTRKAEKTSTKPIRGKYLAVPTIRSAMLKGLFYAGGGVFMVLMGLAQSEGIGWSYLLSGIGLLHLLTGLGVGIYGLYFFSKIPTALQLDRDGVLTKGKVIDKWTRGYRNKVHFIVYEFHDGETARDSVSRAQYNNLSNGSRVPVYYLAENHGVSRLDFSKEGTLSIKHDRPEPQASGQAQRGAAARAGVLFGGGLGYIIGWLSNWAIRITLGALDAPQEYLKFLDDRWKVLPIGFAIVGAVILAWN